VYKDIYMKEQVHNKQVYVKHINNHIALKSLPNAKYEVNTKPDIV
jgi:hypothetical protein